MRITIEEDRLIARGLWGVKFAASIEDIIELRFLASHKYYGPRFLVWLLGGEQIVLRAAIIWTANQGIALTAQDKGFLDAINWFRKNGWDVDAGVRLAFSSPLVRVTVPKF